MKFFKSKKQTEDDVTKFVESWWENQNFPFVYEQIDHWDQEALKAAREIELSISSMPENEREAEHKIRWNNWLKDNPKPLILDQIERYDLSRGIKPFTKEQIEDLENFINFKWSEEDMEKLVDPKLIEKLQKELPNLNEAWFKNYKRKN